MKNPRDGDIWWSVVYGVTQSQAWLKWLSSCSSRKRLNILTEVIKFHLSGSSLLSFLWLFPSLHKTSRLWISLWSDIQILWMVESAISGRTYHPAEKCMSKANFISFTFIHSLVLLILYSLCLAQSSCLMLASESACDPLLNREMRDYVSLL